jgi:hypothetical protein
MPKPKQKKRSTRAATSTNQATMVVTLYDGTRLPIQGGEFLIPIFDGFQNKLFDDYRPAPTTVFRLPYHGWSAFCCFTQGRGNQAGQANHYLCRPVFLH